MRAVIFDFVKTIVLAVAIAVVITSFIKPTLVKGYSMCPTIEPDSYMIVNKIPYMSGMPKAGDIVVFKGHVCTEEGTEKDFIKRVIGVGGDRISIMGGKVYRNDLPVEETYLQDGMTPGDMEEVTVAQNCIFVMGDNRANSLDSRDPSIGQVALEDILGKVVLRLYPFDEIGWM